MNKYLYPIKNLKTKSYIKWWLYRYLGSKGANYILSEILEGTSFTLTDSVDKKFNLFQIFGNTTQDGTPTPENPIPIKNTGDNGSVNEKISNSDGTQEQTLSFPLAQGQKLMEGDYLADDGVHHVMGEYVFTGEEELTLRYGYSSGSYCYSGNFIPNYKLSGDLRVICSHFKYGGTVDGVDKIVNKDLGLYFYYKENSTATSIYFKTTISTVQELKDALKNAKIQYQLANPTTTPYTPEQQTAWEQIKALRTYKPVTHISSEDETPAELKIQYYKER